MSTGMGWERGGVNRCGGRDKGWRNAGVYRGGINNAVSRWTCKGGGELVQKLLWFCRRDKE